MATITITNTSDTAVYLVNHRGIGITIPANDSYVIELAYAVEGESKAYLQSYYTSVCESVNEVLGGDYLTVTFSIPADWGTTVPVMTGATETSAGGSGVVPIPLAGDQNKFLKGDGSWAIVESGSDLTLGETETTAYRGDRGAAAYTHSISDHANIVPPFTDASERTNLASGDSFATLFGKIKKWFTDLGTAAFKSAPASGDATSDQVVLGSDTRLTDKRKTPGALTVTQKFGANTVKSMSFDGDAHILSFNREIAVISSTGWSAEANASGFYTYSYVPVNYYVDGFVLSFPSGADGATSPTEAQLNALREVCDPYGYIDFTTVNETPTFILYAKTKPTETFYLLLVGTYM